MDGRLVWIVWIISRREIAAAAILLAGVCNVDAFQVSGNGKRDPTEKAIILQNIHNSSPRTITSDGPSIWTVSYAPESRCDGSINVDRFPMYDQFVRSRLVASFSK